MSDANSLYLIASAISLVIMAFLAVREARSKRDNNVSDAVQKLAQALNLQSDELVESLAEGAKLRSEVKETQKQILRLTNQQRENMATIDELRTRIENDTRETKALREEVEHLRSKYERAKSVIEKLVKALQDAKANGVDIDMPDINGDLSESIRGWRWKRQ